MKADWGMYNTITGFIPDFTYFPWCLIQMLFCYNPYSLLSLHSWVVSLHLLHCKYFQGKRDLRPNMVLCKWCTEINGIYAFLYWSLIWLYVAISIELGLHRMKQKEVELCRGKNNSISLIKAWVQPVLSAWQYKQYYTLQILQLFSFNCLKTKALLGLSKDIVTQRAPTRTLLKSGFHTMMSYSHWLHGDFH